MKATICFGAWGKQGRLSHSTQILLSLLLAGVSANTNAQDVAALDKAYHPGEQVHVIVTFAAPVELSGGGVAFSLTKLDDEAQRLWTRGFSLVQLKRLQPNQYEATGPVPEYAASGAYRLIRAWSDYLEHVVMDEPAYDDFDVSDCDHFKRRIRERGEMFEDDDKSYSERPEYLFQIYEPQKARVSEKLIYSRQVAHALLGMPEDQLNEKFCRGVHRELFDLRLSDELVRLNMVQQFEAAIKQGYSTEVRFDGFSNTDGEVTLSRIDWKPTLRRFQDTRREGKDFPLRTPAFNVTENGIELLFQLTAV